MKFVWRLHSAIFELIKMLQICVYINIAVLVHNALLDESQLLQYTW